MDSSIGSSNPNVSENPEPGVNQDNQLRGDIFANGEIDLTDDLRAGLKIQRVSDLAFLPEYKISNNPSFLDSDIYLQNFDGRNYGSIYSYSFQALAVGVEDRTQPIVLPVVDYIWAGRPQDWGGKFTTEANAIDILRETGPSERRISLGEQVDLPFSDSLGEKFNLVAGLRGDGYYVLAQPLVTNGPLTNGFSSRIFPQLGLEYRYPWITQSGDSTFLVEPMAAVYAAPVGLNPSKIPNIDSENVDFNDTDLFTRNRFAGYDVVDSGQRVDYGIHANWRDGNANIDGLFGQSYRFQAASPFAIDGSGDGLEHQLTDYVGRLVFTPAQLPRYRLPFPAGGNRFAARARRGDHDDRRQSGQAQRHPIPGLLPTFTTTRPRASRSAPASTSSSVIIGACRRTAPVTSPATAICWPLPSRHDTATNVRRCWPQSAKTAS